MPVIPSNNIEIKDEGASQGFVRSINFVGTGISASVAGSVATLTQGVTDISHGGTNNASLGVSALGIYNGDGSKIVQTTGTALQSWRVNAAGTAVEAYTPSTSSGFDSFLLMGG